MNAKQLERRARLRSDLTSQFLREKDRQAFLAALARQEAFSASAPDCGAWVSARVDDEYDIHPTAHQRMAAAHLSDEPVLEFMRSVCRNALHPYMRQVSWETGSDSDLRRAFPKDATAEQIVVKMWDMKRRGLIEGNIWRGIFWLPDAEEGEA